MTSDTDNRATFTVEGKALTTVFSNGDLVIEGMAAVWDGLDRQGENFAPGAFTKGIAKFLKGQAALCFHHRQEKVLGRVLELRETRDGLFFKARVDGALRKHPELAVYYDQIKNGTLTGMSAAGFFKRVGNKITDVDLVELSVTGTPVHSGTHFAVVESKAVPIAETWPDRLRVAEVNAARRELRSAVLSAKLEAVALS